MRFKWLFRRWNSRFSRNHPKMRHFWGYWLEVLFGCYFQANAEIDDTCIFPHPTSIVIGKGVVIKENCVIYQGVTLGSNSRRKRIKAEREGQTYIAKFPFVERDVIIYANATLVGGITVGEGATVGASALVLKNVPPNATVVAPQAVLLNKKDNNPN